MEEILTFESLDVLSNLFGHLDENIRRIENELKVSVTNRGEELKISGAPEDVADAKKVIELLSALAQKGELIDGQTVAYFILSVREGREESLSDLGGDCICITSRGKPIKPKTLGQVLLSGVPRPDRDDDHA